MERMHKGLPIIIICPPTKPEGIGLLGVWATKRGNYTGDEDENPLYLAFLHDERSVEVITEIRDAAYKTRELTAAEKDRFQEAYYNGECIIRVGKKETPLKPKRNWM